ATVQTSSGNLTLSANQQATPTSGNFVGINVNGATVQSGTGNVLLQGTGGNSGGNNFGVEIQAGGKVQTTGGSGTVTVLGTGGAATVGNLGVRIADTGSLVSSVSGAIHITGHGGNASGSSSNYGVSVENFSQVTSTGTSGGATITIDGTGGTG